MRDAKKITFVPPESQKFKSLPGYAPRCGTAALLLTVLTGALWVAIQTML
jgi:hypothetical protein